MTTTRSSQTSQKKGNTVNIRIDTSHTYLAEDSEFQSMIQDITSEYIEEGQDQLITHALKKSTRLQKLDVLFHSKV